MPMNPLFDTIGKQFIQQYYQFFDAKETRQTVANLYHPSDSLMTFEGTQLQGAQAIVDKLMTIPLDSLQREITLADFQPTYDNGILVMVLGQLKNNSEGDKPMGFSQTFVIRAEGNNYYIFHDIFRLALHNC